jgi:8-oxo-dGTP diphosphatase
MEFYMMEKRHTFTDYYNNEVELVFDEHPFSQHPKHVWVVCTYENRWLLTLHPRRGIEFPGGKVEPGEVPRDAAIREVFEETGATIDQLYEVGQYRVLGKAGTIIKNVYYANILKIEKQESYFETEGPILMDRLPKQLKQQHSFSFMMKDKVLSNTLKYLKAKGLVDDMI